MVLLMNSLVFSIRIYDEGIYENGVWIPGRRLNGDDIALDIDLAAGSLPYEIGKLHCRLSPRGLGADHKAELVLGLISGRGGGRGKSEDDTQDH